MARKAGNEANMPMAVWRVCCPANKLSASMGSAYSTAVIGCSIPA